MPPGSSSTPERARPWQGFEDTTALHSLRYLQSSVSCYFRCHPLRRFTGGRKKRTPRLGLLGAMSAAGSNGNIIHNASESLFFHVLKKPAASPNHGLRHNMHYECPQILPVQTPQVNQLPPPLPFLGSSGWPVAGDRPIVRLDIPTPPSYGLTANMVDFRYGRGSLVF